MTNLRDPLNTFPTEKEGARKLLFELPEDIDGVAEHLYVKGVQAYCGNSERCALAEYLTENVPLPEGYVWSVSSLAVEVLPSRATYNSWSGDTQRTWDAIYRMNEDPGIDLPPHLREFIARFDSHQYEFLERRDG
jgi:hypothetical protein